MDPIAYVNGEYKPLSEASLSVMDIGLMRGYGAYEGITSYGGVPFRLQDHYDRLNQATDYLGIIMPWSCADIDTILRELIVRNGFERTNFRLIVTGGQMNGGLYFDAGKPSLVVIAERHDHQPKEVYENGVSVMLEEHRRGHPKYKTLDYVNAVRLQKERKRRGDFEIVYHHQGNVLEGSISNVIIVKGNVVIASKDDILLGITRKTVLELAREAGYEVEERAVTLDEFRAADEAFMTASFKEVVPIVNVDGAVIGQGVPGAVTKDLMERFDRYVHGA
jgi:branched-chain amino acid aminotransferase